MYCDTLLQPVLKQRQRGYLILLITLLFLSACSSMQKHRIKGPGWYVVKPTDTLYSISWRYGLDYRDLARWNGLSEPFKIFPSQQLILIEPDKLPEIAVATRKTEPVTKKPAVVRKPVTRTKPATKNTRDKTKYSNLKISWRWPTNGKVQNRFSFKDLDRRGIDIAGKIGQPVYAVAHGKVVYSGTGLAGYGNLIIVKHNDTYLSAYAYNRNRLVKEGALVKKGALIANMGVGKDKQPALHFQIRKNGKPVDPLKYLPRQ